MLGSGTAELPVNDRPAISDCVSTVLNNLASAILASIPPLVKGAHGSVCLAPNITSIPYDDFGEIIDTVV
jgi:hypothetical protein